MTDPEQTWERLARWNFLMAQPENKLWPGTEGTAGCMALDHTYRGAAAGHPTRGTRKLHGSDHRGAGRSQAATIHGETRQLWSWARVSGVCECMRMCIHVHSAHLSAL